MKKMKAAPTRIEVLQICCQQLEKNQKVIAIKMTRAVLGTDVAEATWWVEMNFPHLSEWEYDPNLSIEENYQNCHALNRMSPVVDVLNVVEIGRINYERKQARAT